MYMVDYLGMGPFMAGYECITTNGTHVRFSTLKELYEHHLVAITGVEGEGVWFLLSATTIVIYGVGSFSWLARLSLWTKV